ncbi:sodium- and chloride-dependent glycine transporter 2-like isoform X2 [Photinus pyralis]|uniref:sodium- and chloride-dependent glycine transporter 2-like isoform X2 n=1 Tax=Photinus pyralis TaxID=7054 RepID=UPI0012678360|nr:sodium- and chloride-dependent glycine transporter 2-like isoform X2 [Photinus pyralis]
MKLGGVTHQAGVFVLIYLLMVILMGMPIFLLELVIGQYSGLGPDQCFSRIAPIFSGLGYCTLVVIYLVTVYYMVIIAWSVFYFFASFRTELGWGSCDHEFNTKGCFDAIADESCGLNATFYNYKCTSVAELCSEYNFDHMVNRTYCGLQNGTEVHISTIINRTLSSEEYFSQFVLGINGATWENFGEFRWQLFLCLLFSWIVGYFCVIRGIKSSGKAAYFTALFPYVILTALVIRGATLEGAVDGILHYITPKWEMLGDVDVWGSAASQTFYSFGISCGSLITLASYNNFKNNCMKDVVIIAAANLFTSIYAGLAIFAMLGFLAKQLDVPIENVATDGPGLAFVAYPEALLRIPIPQLWSVLFFFMVIILGLGSQFAGIEAVSVTILDKWPHLRKRQYLVQIGICLSCFILAIPMCFSGGIYIFTLLEWNTASWAILLIGLGEIVSVSWAYGCRRFLQHMKDMTISMPKLVYWYWWVCWVIVTPLTLIGVFTFQMVIFAPALYEDYIFPEWANMIGILIGVSTLAPLPIFAIYSYFTKPYTGMEWFKPTKEWGPQSDTSESVVNLTRCTSGSIRSSYDSGITVAMAS